MDVHQLHLSNITVDFPFQPYPCQLAYMEKVVHALQNCTNAILESPTGTGKTLCLLCATLGWREDFVKQQYSGGMGEEQGAELNPWDVPAGSGNAPLNLPKIIYASRTHSQLSQVIHELKNTRYRPSVAIIGSREQLCIHNEVSKKETNSEKVHLCRAKVKSHSCFYYNNTDVKRLKDPEPVMDIEDLVMIGSRQKMCPYYLARELKSQADIIFMPYNYILDIKTRQMHGVDVEGAVVILDEAHNIERVCEDSASFDITSGDIAQCIGDVDHILKLKLDLNLYASQEEGEEEDIKDYLNLKQFFLTVEETLDAVDIHGNQKREVVKPGEYIFQFFDSAGLNHSTCGTLLDQCSKVISYLTTDNRSVHRNGNSIQKFVDAIKIVYSVPPPSGKSHAHHYKVYIKSEEVEKKSGRSDSWSVAATSEKSRKETRTLSYWCFSPGYAMAELASHGVRSVILTSGTLSPLNSFSSELQIDFPIRYEGSHVITSKQICVSVVSKGCDGVTLNSSYANRSTLSYQTSLGNTLVNFSRSVPHGLLVFFPSYPVMNNCVERWRESGILHRIELNKPVFLEPRRKMEFIATMDAFYEKINDSSRNGAAFFAVCRGKVSEGLDFADINGRAVVITGLPYPPRMDPKVTLKMQYLKDTKSSHDGLSGEEWYKQQASRAVNQAIGRVIRHRNDYGAILLCDERFGYSNALSQLPKWIQPHVQTYTKFGLVQRDLNLFFKDAEKEFGYKIPSPKKSGSSSTTGRGDRDHDTATTSSGSGALRLPVVVRDPSQRSSSYKEALKHAQSANVVDIHIPSRIPRASLDRLEMEAAKRKASKSLISSLAECEVKAAPKRLVDLYVPSQSTQSTLTTVEEASGSSRQPRPQPSLPSTSSSIAAPTKKTLVLSSKKEAAKMATVTGYIKEVKECLSNESYNKFKDYMRLYKKEHDVYKLFDSLKLLFNRSPLFHLLRGMLTFVDVKHKTIFSTSYQEFTGRTLEVPGGWGGVKRGLEGTKDQTKVKVQKIEEREGSKSTKDQPKVKVQKMEAPLVSKDAGITTMQERSHDQLSTRLLNTQKCLDNKSNLNRGRTK